MIRSDGERYIFPKKCFRKAYILMVPNFFHVSEEKEGER